LKKLVGLYDGDILPGHLQRTLRHFLFMCLTGIRISDFLRLKHDHIQDNALKFTPHKTRAKKRGELHIPLVAKARKLIQDEGTAGGLIFQSISEQKMNDQLKDISRRVEGLKKEITNHSARHTFATLFIAKTKDVATLQRILGHSNIRETMMYVHIDTKLITDQMGNFDRLLELE
jgi:site-specific recombinase XerD